MNAGYMGLFMGKDVNWGGLIFPLTFLNYQWFVDLFLAGIIGVGFYWHFSGRMWCRFACPLAALMHVYARFSRFRIFSDKKKCISCSVCTSVCHQGIDVMNFANKGFAYGGSAVRAVFGLCAELSDGCVVVWADRSCNRTSRQSRWVGGVARGDGRRGGHGKS